MSKSLLKKELAKFTKEQLTELILEMYDARKEIKDYLNFYLNPDSEALYNKYYKSIQTELFRHSRYNLKARFSKINKLVKDFESYSPDYEYRDRMYFTIIVNFIALTSHYAITQSQLNGCLKLASQYLKVADKNERLDEAVDNLASTASQTRYGMEYYRERLASIIEEYMEENKL